MAFEMLLPTSKAKRRLEIDKAPFRSLPFPSESRGLCLGNTMIFAVSGIATVLTGWGNLNQVTTQRACDKRPG